MTGYEPILHLARGGMGTVFLARTTGVAGFERIVVLKRMHAHLLEHKEAMQRFVDEARQAALIHHANVVSIHQVGEDIEGLFLVYDYVEGAGFDELVDRTYLRQRRVPVPIVLRIAVDALAGLHAAHTAHDSAGNPIHLLHRDISLQNIIVGRDGVSRVTDFGIAKSSMARSSTDSRDIVGKLLYMAPEYLNRSPVGPPLDVYALGMSLWIALTGREPWPGATETQLVSHICLEGVPLLAEAGVEIAPQVAALVDRACQILPADRFQTAREMAEAIEDVGRATGWLASHGEVARFVEEVVGVDLQRRREQIATELARSRSEKAPRSRDSLPPVLSLAPPADSNEPFSSSEPPTQPAPDLPITSRARFAVVGFAAALLLVVGVGAFAYRQAPHEGVAPPPPPSVAKTMPLEPIPEAPRARMQPPTVAEAPSARPEPSSQPPPAVRARRAGSGQHVVISDALDRPAPRPADRPAASTSNSQPTPAREEPPLDKPLRKNPYK